MRDMGNQRYTLESILNGPTALRQEISHPFSENRKAITALLKKTISKLSRFFTISKASLAYYNQQNESLRVTHIYKNRRYHTSLTLIIQNTNSTMYQVLMQGFPVADNYPEKISTNVIERKIMLSDSTQSVLMVPLIHDAHKIGILTLSSDDESAFGTYLDGVGEGIIADFTAQLHELCVSQKAIA